MTFLTISCVVFKHSQYLSLRQHWRAHRWVARTHTHRHTHDLSTKETFD